VKGSGSTTRKKVVIRKLDKELMKGYLDSEAYVTPLGVELLDLEGRRLKVPLDQIKGVYFVREFDGHRDRSEHKVFLSRPRMNGLWVRMTFKDAEILDGLVSQDLLSHDPFGYHVTLPDVYSNNLKIYIPRSALLSMRVLDVITNVVRRPYRQVRQVRRKPSELSEPIGLSPPAGHSEAP